MHPKFDYLAWYSENWDENSHLPQRKCQCICSACKIYFLDWKKHGCLQQVYIANGDVSSRWQSHKTTENEDVHANVGRQKRTKKQWTSSVGVFCFGKELVRGEEAVSLKRQGEENCWIIERRFLVSHLAHLV